MTLQRQATVWIGALIAFGLALFLLRGILLPFVAGMAIAYFFDPVADRLEALGLNRLTATIVISLAGILLGVVLLIVLVPMLEEQIASFIKRLPSYLEQLRALAVEISDGALAHFIASVDPEIETTLKNIAGSAVGWVGRAVQSTLSGGLAFLSFLSLLFVTPVVAFYLLLDWDRMIAIIDGWLPREHAPTIRRLANEMDEMLAGFVRGQVTVCLVLGTFYAVSLTMLGLEFGLIVGIIAGIVTFIPYVGAATGLVLSGGLALVQFWPDPIMIGAVLAVFFVGQAIEGNILTPYLVGSRIRLHPVWVMFALFAFGALFGFVGVLLAVPLAAVIGVLARFGIGEYLRSPLYLGARRHGQDAPGRPSDGT